MKVLGQEVSVLLNQIHALFANIVSWIFSCWARVPDVVEWQENSCVVISGPGGSEKLQLKEFPEGTIGATVGYNVPPFKSPFVMLSNQKDIPDDCVLVRVSNFSVNYADVCIRWGLYESAIKYVGWPIVPGFDFTGVIEYAGKNSLYTKGDEVFGYTMFGSYTSKLLVPSRQIRKRPQSIPSSLMAGVPAVAATALHCLHLAGAWPSGKILSRNKAALIHSAGGGVGSMLVQMCKILGYSPIVAVVGSAHKISYCVELGADYVICKSDVNLWSEAKRISSDGYVAIFDANGIETVNDSYEHLSTNGRLIIYGFHTNLPKASDLLSPLTWCSMIYRMVNMPKYDPMDMVLTSKTVSGFNLSFFSTEYELIEAYMDQITTWLDKRKIVPSKVTTFKINEIRKAHALIQTGKSIGKIVVQVNNK